MTQNLLSSPKDFILVKETRQQESVTDYMYVAERRHMAVTYKYGDFLVGQSYMSKSLNFTHKHLFLRWNGNLKTKIIQYAYTINIQVLPSFQQLPVIWVISNTTRINQEGSSNQEEPNENPKFSFLSHVDWRCICIIVFVALLL